MVSIREEFPTALTERADISVEAKIRIDVRRS
jgi:hypothetical protein